MAFARRAFVDWQLRTRSLALGGRTRIMAVLNVTPDSFSDGGRFADPQQAIDEALRLLDAGADILDIGGESTRPDSTPLPAAGEIARVLPVIEGVLRARPEAILSADTYHAETARAAVQSGAEIVNDVSGFLWDSEMAATCAELACGLVLMHARGRPAEWRHMSRLDAAAVVPLVRRELDERLVEAAKAGVDPRRVVLDPGYGFGKLGAENFALLAGQEELLSLGHPLLIGLSRKSFLGKDIPAEQRSAGSLAGMVAAILAGASIVRVHEVQAAVEAAAVADAVLEAPPVSLGLTGI